MKGVSLDDFLETFDYSKRDYTAKNLYNAYNDFKKGELIADISKKHGVPYATIYGWEKRNSKSHIIKQLNILEEKRLLPLNSSNPHFQIFQELYLHTLFSGHIRKLDNHDSYILDLSNTKDKLEGIGKVLKKELGFNYKIYRNKTNKNPDKGYIFRINYGNRYKTPLCQGLYRLLVASGMPVGKKSHQLIKIPRFINKKLIIYYAYKLRGEELRFNLWSSTNNLISVINMHAFLYRLKNSGIKLSGVVRRRKCYNANRSSYVIEHTPRISIEKEDKSDFYNLLNNYKPLLPIS